MATIDNLNFKVILDDADFSARVKRDVEEAKRLNVQLSDLLSARQRLSGLSASAAAEARRALDLESRRAQAAAKTAEAEERVRAAAERTSREHQRAVEAQSRAAAAAERLSREQRRTADQADRMNRSLSLSRGVLRQLTSLAAGYFSAVGVTRFLGSVIRVTGEFEMQREALRNIVQDARGADVLFDRLQKLAVESPYTFSEITSYAKQLSAFSVPLDELYDTTKMLADVSAGLGVDMGRMILAYGQVRSAAFLRGQEVRQFTEAGVPLLQKLAEQFSELEGRAVSTGEVFDKISKRLVPFEMVQKVMKDLTSEGGQFFEMQAVLADTLKGKVMKLKDAYEQMLFAIGEGNGGFFHGAVDAALGVVKNYEAVGRVLKEAAATFGIMAAGATVASIANGKLAASLTSLKDLKMVKWLSSNPYAVFAAAAVAAGSVVYELIRHLREQNEEIAIARDTVRDYNAELASENSKLNYLWANLEKAARGTREYDEARRRIMKDYGQYLSSMDRERIMAGDLAGVYDRLTASVRKSMQERFLNAGMEGLDGELKSGMELITKRFSDLLGKVGVTDKGLSAALWDYVLGKDFDDFPDEEMRKRVLAAKEKIDGLMDIADPFTGKRLSYIGLDDLRDQAKALADEIDRQRNSLLGYFDAVAYYDAGKSEGELLDWQKEVNAALEAAEGDAAATSGNMIRKSSETLKEYLDRLRKSYKELTEDIANASPVYQKDEIEGWKKDLEGVRAVAKLLGIDLKAAKFSDLTKDNTGKLTDAQKRERDEINATVRTVEKLKDAYEKLRESIPDEMLGDAMKALFPDTPAGLRDNADYEGQLRALADRLRAIPGEAEAADRILTGMGEDATKSLTDAFAAAERFAEAVERLASKDFALDGSGVAFKISKAVGDLRTKNAKVDIDVAGIKKDFAAASGSELAMKALRIKYGEEFWDAYVARGEEALDELAAREKAYNTRKTQEQVTQLAKEYVSENVGKGKGIDLTDLSQKSLRQLAALRKKLKGALDGVDIGDLGLSDETVKRLEESDVTLDDFAAAVRALLNGDLDKLSDEMKEKLLKGAESAAKGVSQLGDTFVQLGEIIGSDRISSIGETMKGVGDAFANIASGAASGGVWGAVAAAAAEALNGVTGAILNEAKEAAEAAQNSTDFANALALLKLEASDLSTVFGDAMFTEMAEYFDRGREAAELYKNALDELDEKYGTMDLINSGTGAKDDRGFFAYDGPRFNKQIYDIDEALDGLKRMQVKTKDRNWFQQLLGMSDEHTALGNLAPDLWDADGAFNVENAKKFLETNTQIDETQRKELQNLVDIKEQYDEIQEKIDDMVGSLVGSLAGDMVDSFLDNFKQMGDAVDDLDSAFQNLGETILKSMLQSYVIDEILDEFEPRVKDMFKQYSEGQISAEDVAERTADLAGHIRKKTEDAADIINAMIASFDNVNLIGKDTTESSGSLSDGIKAVTEDTASLIASYMNAVRADVSYAKAQREAMLELLRTALPTASPTLQEYLAQIQANTYETAAATREMLSEFRGVLAPHSEGGSGVKVVAE